MNKKIANAIKSLKQVSLTRKIAFNEPLKHHTSFKIGGECLALIEPVSEQELLTVIRLLTKLRVKFFVIGNGTNLLVKDVPLKIFIIKLSKNFANIEVEGNTLKALAGTSLVDACKTAADNSLSGLEWSFGIPGTIGGAVFMNAGAYGGQMSDCVKSVKFYNGKKVIELSNNKLKYAYRNSLFKHHKHYVIISATLALKEGVKEDIKALAEQNFKKRKDNHPLNYPSAGSVFKRHKKLIASKAIDELNLKGYKIGGAEVSQKHAGFIINKGNATSRDVLQLVKYIKKCVYKKHRVKLQLEVKILGD
ncbi:MAG: UDP-N-acetylmuramate dehydrogenase [Clostridia bacterium]|nr:UDP-N-acetylmuramate dehydrogenase [Clostridia bacterium]